MWRPKASWHCVAFPHAYLNADSLDRITTFWAHYIWDHYILGSTNMVVIMVGGKLKKMRIEGTLHNNLQGNIQTAGKKILAQISATPGKC